MRQHCDVWKYSRDLDGVSVCVYVWVCVCVAPEALSFTLVLYPTLPIASWDNQFT